MTENRVSDMGSDDDERRDYVMLIDSLTGILDVRGGLAEAVNVGHYVAMSSHIISLLDLDAGLGSALSAGLLDRLQRSRGSALAVNAIPVDDPHPLEHLSRFRTALHRRYSRTGDVAVLDEMIDVCRLLEGATNADDPDRLNYLADLGRLLLDRYQQTKKDGLLEETIRVHQDLTAALPSDDPERPRHLSNLGLVLWERFERSKDPTLLDPIIDVFRRAVTVMPAANAQRPKILFNLAAALVEQAARSDPSNRQARWQEAAAMMRTAADALPTDDPDWPLVRCNLGDVLVQKFEQLNDRADLREAVNVFRSAVETTPVDSPHGLRCLAKLAWASLARAKLPDSPIELLDEAIAIQRQLLEATPIDNPVRSNHAARLAGALQLRHRRFGDLDALQEAVRIHRTLATAIPPEHSRRRYVLHDLGNALRVRDVVADHPSGVTDETLEILREAAGLPADRTAHPAQTDFSDPGHYTQHWSDLAEALGIRAKHTGELSIIDEWITVLRLLIDGLDSEPRHLRNLGSALLFRHGHSGGAELLDEAIRSLRLAVQATPTEHPDRPACLGQLGEALHRRYHGSRDVTLLDEAIEMLREASAGTPIGDPVCCHRLSLLGRALQHRYELGGDRVLLEQAVTAHQQAASLPSKGTLERSRLLNDLGEVLLRLARHTDDLATFHDSVQAYRQAADATPSDYQDRIHHLCGLGSALIMLSERSGDSSLLDEAISVLREASAAAPDGHPDQVRCLVNLSSALHASYRVSRLQARLDEAIRIGQHAVELSDEPTVLALAAANLNRELHSRSQANADAAALDDAIRYAPQALGRLPADHVDRSARLCELGDVLMASYQRTGELDLLNDAIRYYRQATLATPADHFSQTDVYNSLGAALLGHYNHTGELRALDEAIDLLRQAVEVLPAEHPGRPDRLTNLGLVLHTRYGRTGDQADLTEAVERQRAAAVAGQHHPEQHTYLTNLGTVLTSLFRVTGDLARAEESIQAHREALTACPAGHAMQPCLHANLSTALLAQYRQTNELAVLDEAVKMQRRAVAGTPTNHPHRPVHLAELSTVLLAHHDHTGDDRNLVEAAEVSRQAAAAATVATPRGQIDVHARWGRLAARTGNWRAALDALATAVALLPQAVPVGLHRDDQEYQLAGFAGLASDAAACALQAGDPRRAVELLEQGRGVLLTQAVARGEEFELRERDVALADRLDWLRAELARGADVTVEWEQLMKGIRTMPGFERFLLPPAIDELLTDLPNGPVVLINVSQFRSDALILDAGEVRVVPLPTLNPDGVRDRAEGFLAAIEVVYGDKYRSGERQQAQQNIRGTLCWLWEDVAAPVLDTLALTARADPSTPWPRLWWSPTGLLSLLPLHAAGHHHDQPHDPSGLLPRTVIDRVISSYTPTVQMLRRARQRLQELPADAPRVLMVSMPNAPGASRLSHAWQEAFASVGQFNIRILSDLAATRQQVIAELPAYTWVHFACHSYTDFVHPSTSYLVLHDHAEQRLTAQDISRLRLRGVQLAFLSASDTARTSGDLADEAIHLASSFQIAGYPHVIATLWPLRDQDANLVSEEFYERLADSARADQDCFSTAIHEAIRVLRKSSRNNPWEWGAYIHMGA